ncbi:nucleoprotein TPR [Dorcoceras hygrometricum]|uniref:Nucleoprotein TPR n=1 Tax=Dorcoceras hygrometricum TaxID=472368 RepID=A0A2Z7C5P9_9LAMI|nr:nucleoprotein TPR [Dorcoceras hygrometricum]
MSLFDLQDVCIAIGSLATLDLPMVVDLIGIYGLKGPYYYTHPNPTLNSRPPLPPLPKAAAAGLHRRPPSPPLIDRTCSDQFFEENPSVLISSGLLVQADEGVSLPVMDLIDESTAAYREEPVFL